jgi:nucleotide-binding universal stress UspA family protein
MKRNAHVVVGSDFSENADLALDCALGLTADSGGELHAIHVIPALTLPIAGELGGQLAAREIEMRPASA